MVRPDEMGKSCLGKLSREMGQRRVPEPPDRMTGRMLVTGALNLLLWDADF
jgi:hypothetical protein